MSPNEEKCRQMSSRPPPSKRRKQDTALVAPSGARFQSAVTVADEDLLSRQPERSILQVFSRLDEADLRRLSATSQAMNAMVRKLGETLDIRSNGRKRLTIRVIYGTYTVLDKTFDEHNSDHGDCEICRDQEASSNVVACVAALHQAFKAISVAEQRFDFMKIVIDIKMPMDPYFALCERYICIPDREMNLNIFFGNVDIDSLTEWLLKLRPKKLHIMAREITKLITPLFIEALASAVTNPSLELLDRRFSDEADDAPSDCNFRASLAQFVDFQSHNLILDVGSFMEIVRMRYDRSIEGYWYVRTSRPLETTTIEEGLDQRMEGRQSEQSFGEQFEIISESDGKKMITLRTNYQLVAEAKPPTRGWKRKHKFYVQVWFH